MLDIAALVAGLAVLAIPGIFLWRVVFPDHDLVDRLTWGATAGLALAVLIAFYVSLFRLSLFWPLWMGVVALSLLLAWLRPPSEGGLPRVFSSAGNPSRGISVFLSRLH